LYFSLSLFVSATILFLVQPMIGKMILPQLGGTPAVWNTCMVFFQGVLLVGYGYTHLLTTTQPTKRQVLIQSVLLFLPFLVLPFSLGDWTPPTESNPIFQLLIKLSIMVGLPFLMVSTTAPLLQKWFFHTGHPAARDPYFLYGASNFGSMLGLGLYPTVIEPWLQVTAPEGSSTWDTQVHLWTFLYAIFVALVIGCAVIVWQALAGKWAGVPETPAPAPTDAPKPVSAAEKTAIAAAPSRRRMAKIETVPADKTTAAAPVIGESVERDDNITPWRRLRWVGLAAAPSSLMLGVTTYATTDIAAIAFFWIIPLALYLMTFILVFARWPWVWTGTPHTVVLFVQPCVLLFLVLTMISGITIDNLQILFINLRGWETVITFFLHIAAFFTTALMCHGELARDRPSTKMLTEFYFWMSVGGVLGGLFNALFAPIVFQYGIWEYMVAMAFACLLRSNLVDQPQTLIKGDSTAAKPTTLGYALDWSIPLAIGVLCYTFQYVGMYYDSDLPFWIRKKFLLASLVITTLALSLRPVRFGLAVGALFIATTAFERSYDNAVYEGRGFFGLLRVKETTGEWTPMPRAFENEIVPHEWKVYRRLIHGGINHGQQIVQYKDDRAAFFVMGASFAAAGGLPPVYETAVVDWMYYRRAGDIEFENKEMTMRKRREPITYFHERNGVAELFHKLSWPKAQPVAEVVNMNGLADFRMPASMIGLGGGDQAAWAMLANTQSEPPIAVMGLGTGILACYAKAYQHVDIFEIDPLVKGLSLKPEYVPPWHPDRGKMSQLPDPTFYFVQDAMERWAKIDVKLGDGRLVIKKAPEKYFHIIVLDAFSSDAIPVHLLTKNAVELYLEKLADGGVLLFNTTNRYVRLEGVLAAIAKDLDLDCRHCPDWAQATSDHPDRYAADWVVMQRKAPAGGYANGGLPIAQRLEETRTRLRWNGHPVIQDGKTVEEARWREVRPLAGPVWTDGYSNMLNPKVMPWIRPWSR
jgi:hypothetical protein